MGVPYLFQTIVIAQPLHKVNQAWMDKLQDEGAVIKVLATEVSDIRTGREIQEAIDNAEDQANNFLLGDT